MPDRQCRTGMRVPDMMRPILCVLVALGIAGRAGAEPVRAQVAPFTWQAPAGCPSAKAVRAKTERRYGGSIEGAIQGIEITVSRERGELVATIDARAITVADEIRTLRARRCDELADAVALILARFAADHDARGGDGHARVADHPPPGDRASGAAGDDDGAAGPELATPVDEDIAMPAMVVDIDMPPMRVDVAAAARDDRRADDGRGWGGGLQIMGVSGVGALPSVNLGGELGGYVRRADRFASVAMARWVPAGAAIGADTMTLDVVSVRGGWGPQHLPLRAWVMGEVGQIRRDPVAWGAPDGVSRWTAVGGGFGVAWPMAPQARQVGTVELAIPVARTTMVMAGTDDFEPDGAAARCSFGIEVGWR